MALLAARLSLREALHGLDEGSTRIVPIATESAAAMFGLGTYKDASPRLAGLTWGAEDLAADIGALATRIEGEWSEPVRVVRSLALFAAAAAGVPAIDTVHTDFRDLEGLRRECAAAARDGFSGKLAIHPDQVEIINEAFSPTPEALEEAARIVAAFAEPGAAGVTSIDGRMLDRPHLEAAERLLKRAGPMQFLGRPGAGRPFRHQLLPHPAGRAPPAAPWQSRCAEIRQRSRRRRSPSQAFASGSYAYQPVSQFTENPKAFAACTRFSATFAEESCCSHNGIFGWSEIGEEMTPTTIGASAKPFALAARTWRSLSSGWPSAIRTSPAIAFSRAGLSKRMKRQGESLPWSGTRAAMVSIVVERRRIRAGLAKHRRRNGAPGLKIVREPLVHRDPLVLNSPRWAAYHGAPRICHRGTECSIKPMSQTLRALLFLALTVLANGAAAQSAEELGADIFTQGLVAPNLDAEMGTPAETLAPPPTYTPPLEAPAGAALGQNHRLVLEARLVADGHPLTDGLVWRVFSAQADADGQLPLVSQAEGGTATLQLAPGDYLIHAAFGRAGATKRVAIADDDQMESLVLDAGGLELNSVVGDGRAISPDQITFEVLRQDETGELVAVVPKAAPGQRIAALRRHLPCDQPLRQRERGGPRRHPG